MVGEIGTPQQGHSHTPIPPRILSCGRVSSAGSESTNPIRRGIPTEQ
jgi:hypothetical protein